MRALMVTAIIVWNVACGDVSIADDERRAGLRETFDRVDGWQPGRAPDRPDRRFAPRGLKCEAGRLIIDTPLGTLAQISADYFKKRGIRPHPNPVWLSKRYGEVDLDRFPYLVARMPHSQCFTVLRVNNRETKVLYTTGLHVQDLRETGLRGKQPIVLQILIGSNSRRVVLDDIRLVSDLTEDEKRALIPRGYTVRPQRLRCEPYQGLEALYERTRAPLAELQRSAAFAGTDESSEWAIFRDQATGAPMWRLTRHPGTDAGEAFSANGRWVLLDSAARPGKKNICDLRTGRIRTLPSGSHTFFPSDGDRTVLVEFRRKSTRGRIVVSACDLPSLKLKTLIDEEIREAPRGQVEMAFSDVSNRFVVGFRDQHVVYLGDPGARAEKRLRRIRLPYPIKNLWLTDNDRFILFANCFTTQMWFYDVRAGKLFPHSQRRGGGHTALGGGMLFGSYGRVGKIVAPFVDRTDSPGDSVRLHGNYHNCSVPVDYGIISPDGRWAFHDGVGGDVDRQIVAFDLNDPGNVIPVFFHNTSSVGYDVKPYVKVSPDSTKLLLHSSDMLGDGEVFLVPFQRPEPPRNIVVRRTAEGVRITWKPAKQSAETRGYNIYHSTGRTVGFTRLNEELIPGNNFLHRDADPRSVYLITAVEHSRLESRFSAPAMRPDRPRDDAVCLFLEAETADAKLPFRRQYDGYAANFATMRLMPETPDEIEGSLTFPLSAARLHSKGRKIYRIALRARLRGDIYPESRGQGKAKAILTVDGKPVGRFSLSGRSLGWHSAFQTVSLEPGDHRLTVRSSAPGVEIDRVALFSTDAGAAWLKAGPADAEPEVAAPFTERSGGVTVRADGPYSLMLTWSAPESTRVDCFSIYASGKPDPRESNETLVGSTRGAARFRDTGLRPASRVHYLVVGSDSRGRKVFACRGTGTTAPLKGARTIRLKAADARLDAALERRKDKDRTFVRVRPNSDVAQRNASVRYKLDIPQAGNYAVWISNRPHSRYNQVVVTVGGKSGNCRLSRYMWPGRRVEHMYIRGSAGSVRGGRVPSGFVRDRRKMPERRWYVERITFARRAPTPSADVFPLKAGRQEIAVTLNVAQQRARSLDLGDVVVTNDLTWRPDDHDPRTQFVPESAPDTKGNH